ncbi:uncharacterized protein FOMMEDRAFT_170790 [Fomitiporia mediterranea MF3/22]|uniref:uncharacterized protein n=1 Tax=Fomitiporia mediterranea (strain MF3/22) TaxID=694068 RepID=UPI0004409ACB|nr:uncharacterized protein FOMMEDRAFT_170790 [Fomitiporia mediterranea MF3/22]EJC99034.1 hypothetical protein FOMMEDRAFT_170790 [Fomitiporia mediterranea MF3/22]
MELFARSDVVPVSPSRVPTWVQQMRSGQYFQLATTSALLYDCIITMDKEVHYFWKSPWKAVNGVYFANRYIGIYGTVAHHVWYLYGVDITRCNFSQWSRNISFWCTILLIDYILMLRVLALYSQDRYLRLLSIFLKALLALEAAFKMALLVYLTLEGEVAVAGLPWEGATVCGQLGSGPWQWGMINWILPMVYSVLLMALALYKATEFWKMQAGFKGFKLVKVLIQDQAIYFLLVVACVTMNVIEYKIYLANNFWASVLINLGSASWLSVLGSRLLFNLKEAGENGLNEGMSYRMKPLSLGEMSDIQFAEGRPDTPV